MDMVPTFTHCKDNCLKKDFWLGLGVISLAMVVALTFNIILFIQYHRYYTADKHLPLFRGHQEESGIANDTIMENSGKQNCSHFDC